MYEEPEFDAETQERLDSQVSDLYCHIKKEDLKTEKFIEFKFVFLFHIDSVSFSLVFDQSLGCLGLERTLTHLASYHHLTESSVSVSLKSLMVS